MLKPSELHFNIPIRMYDPAVDEDKDEEREGGYYAISPNKPVLHRYIVDFVALRVQDIRFWGATFYKKDDFDIVLKEGADATIVSLGTGEEFFCDWNKERFEKEYNAHIAKLDGDFDFIEINEDNVKDIEAAVKDFKKQQKLKNVNRTKETTQKP